jgi:predicted esterase
MSAMSYLRSTSLRALGACLLLTLTVGSAGATEFLDATYDVDVQEDIVYGAAINARGENETLWLDLYRPTVEGAPLTDRPAVVFAHGGSFKGGSRKGGEIRGYLQQMAAQGWAMASISYRVRPTGTPGSKPNQDLIIEAALGDSDTLRDAQHDMQAAVRFLRANAATYGIDPALIAVGGSSAGAVTALQAAINEEDPGDSGTPGVSSDVAAAVSVSGAADPDHIEAGDPPFFMMHGGLDATVPAPLGQQACAIATALLNGCEFHFFPTAGHTPWSQWTGYAVRTSSRFLCHVMLADRIACGEKPLPLTIA